MGQCLMGSVSGRLLSCMIHVRERWRSVRGIGEYVYV